jgi:hypothetical protein
MPGQFPCETDDCDGQPTYDYNVYDEWGEFICTRAYCGPCSERLEDDGKDIRAATLRNCNRR